MTDYMKSLIDRLAAAFLRYESQPAALQARCSDILEEARSKWRAELEQAYEREQREFSEVLGSYEVVLVTADGLRCKKKLGFGKLPLEIISPIRSKLPASVEDFNKPDAVANCVRRYKLKPSSCIAGYPEYWEVQT